MHGLTTAASIWESAAIGMAAGAGLLLLAFMVTAMHFLVVVGFMPLARRLSARLSGSIRLHLTYTEGRGVMSHSSRRASDGSGSSRSSPRIRRADRSVQHRVKRA